VRCVPGKRLEETGDRNLTELAEQNINWQAAAAL
jgi:hypothetical protein